MYQLPSNITVQIVQQHPVDVPVIRCLVVETRRVFRCGMSHHAYGSTTVSFGKKIVPTRQECEMMIENQVGSISGRVIPLNANSTTHTAFVSEGTMDSDGDSTYLTWPILTYRFLFVKCKHGHVGGKWNGRTKITILVNLTFLTNHLNRFLDQKLLNVLFFHRKFLSFLRNIFFSSSSFYNSFKHLLF